MDNSTSKSIAENQTRSRQRQGQARNSKLEWNGYDSGLASGQVIAT